MCSLSLTHTHTCTCVQVPLSPLMNATTEHLLNGLIFHEPLRELIGEKGMICFTDFLFSSVAGMELITLIKYCLSVLCVARGSKTDCVCAK